MLPLQCDNKDNIYNSMQGIYSILYIDTIKYFTLRPMFIIN